MDAPSRLTAGLAGIGAVFLTTAILRAITIELWFLQIVVTDGPPPRVDQLAAVAWFAGSFVAARLGGLRAVGILGLYALGVISLAVSRSVIQPVLDCALIPRLDCAASVLDRLVNTPWALEGLAGQLWIVPGVALGVLAARIIRGRIPLRSGLAALSVFAVGIVIANHVTRIAAYTICFDEGFAARCIDPEYIFWFATHVGLGVLAGMRLIRLGGQARDALITGGILFVTYLPGPVHQMGMVAGDGVPAVLGQVGGLTGALTYILVSLTLLTRRGQPRSP